MKQTDRLISGSATHEADSFLCTVDTSFLFLSPPLYGYQSFDVRAEDLFTFSSECSRFHGRNPVDNYSMGSYCLTSSDCLVNV